jgi:uncharacterized protein (TIGR03435 family)
MTLFRKQNGPILPTAICLLFVVSLCAAGQTSNSVSTPEVKFSVVSVRANRSDSERMSYSIPRDGDSITFTNYPLFYMVIFSNDFHRSDLVFGMPGWTKNERFDLVAKVAPEDVETYHSLSPKQRMAMFQEVLADRFKLRFHREPKELPALEMMVAKGGPKLRAPDATTPLDLKQKYGQSITLLGRGVIKGEGGTMADLALMLTTVTHEGEFIDKTGLTGTYDFTLEYSEESESDPVGGGPESIRPSDAPDLPTALREQLGIQLKPGKAVFECFVVDHIEKPTPN